MKTYQISNRTSGVILGTYRAEDERGALNAMAKDGGYRDHAAACHILGIDADNHDLMVVAKTESCKECIFLGHCDPSRRVADGSRCARLAGDVAYDPKYTVARDARVNLIHVQP